MYDAALVHDPLHRKHRKRERDRTGIASVHYTRFQSDWKIPFSLRENWSWLRDCRIRWDCNVWLCTCNSPSYECTGGSGCGCNSPRVSRSGRHVYRTPLFHQWVKPILWPRIR